MKSHLRHERGTGSGRLTTDEPARVITSRSYPARLPQDAHAAPSRRPARALGAPGQAALPRLQALRCGGACLTAPWPPLEQPPPTRTPRRGASALARTLLRLRPDPRLREALGGAWPLARRRDGAPVDDRRRAVASAAGARSRHPPVTRAAGILRRTRPTRREPARLVRGTRPPLHASELRR